jgi:hypothetical protein
LLLSHFHRLISRSNSSQFHSPMGWRIFKGANFIIEQLQHSPIQWAYDDQRTRSGLWNYEDSLFGRARMRPTIKMHYLT